MATTTLRAAVREALNEQGLEGGDLFYVGTPGNLDGHSVDKIEHAVVIAAAGWLRGTLERIVREVQDDARPDV